MTAHVETKLGLTQSCQDSRVGFVRGEKKSSILLKSKEDKTKIKDKDQQ